MPKLIVLYLKMNHQMELQDLRTEYGKGSLQEEKTPENPFELFGDWLTHAMYTGCTEANAMVLSTVSETGCPSSRVLLLKTLDEKGFVFYTNYDSLKGRQLKLNPQGALLFFWADIERQVRIEGVVEKVEDELSDAYFFSRPLRSRVSAVVSPQSTVIPSRTELEKMHNDFQLAHPEGRFNRPANWGGYRLVPRVFEFWQGRSNRLHDRIQYSREAFVWKKCRLAP